MASEKLLIELTPYYRGLLDMTRTLIHLLRPDLGPPTQSHTIQWLLMTLPIDQLLSQAIKDREKYLKEHAPHDPEQPGIQDHVIGDDGLAHPIQTWADAPGKSSRKRAPARKRAIGKLGKRPASICDKPADGDGGGEAGSLSVDG